MRLGSPGARSLVYDTEVILSAYDLWVPYLLQGIGLPAFMLLDN